MKKFDVVKIKRLDDEIVVCELITIEDKLEVFYREIGCDCIDIVSRRFGGRLFDVICDDEALLKGAEDWPTSLWTEKGLEGERIKEGLFGTLLLCHSDQEGNLTSATPEDLLKVQSSYIRVVASANEVFFALRHTGF